MATKQHLSERSKYTYILQLSKDQISALDADDVAQFNKVLAVKGALIASLKDAAQVVENDPSLLTTIRKIEDTEKQAEQLLCRRLGQIRKEMDDLHQLQRAKNSYRKANRKVPNFVPSAETPMLFDLQS